MSTPILKPGDRIHIHFPGSRSAGIGPQTKADKAEDHAFARELIHQYAQLGVTVHTWTSSTATTTIAVVAVVRNEDPK